MDHVSKISRKAWWAVASLVVSSQAYALGLGDAEVRSYLNQPLIARIDLLSNESDDLSSVTAKLASAADYELIGASMESVSVPLSFSIEDIDGDAYILATSDLPMTSPIVRLIVEVDWSSGRMLREYTLFLDPASIASTAPAPQVSTRAPDPVAVAEPPPAVETAPVEDAMPEPAEDAMPEPAEPAPTVPSTEEYGPVQSGETLWGIASRWSRGSGLDVNKVMLAIQRENPRAFMRNNINLLKRGAILRMPDISEVEQISTANAFAEVTSQTEAFQQRVGEGTVTSASTPLLAESADEADAAADTALDLDFDEPQVEEPTVEEPAVEQMAEFEETRDQLELVPPSEAELDSVYGFEENPEGAELTASDNVTSLRENLARTEEELINEQQQNEYLQQQIEELEKRLAEQEQASTVSSAELASMEQRLKNEREAAREESGMTGLIGWLVAIGVAIVALSGWLLSRRGRAAEAAEADASEEALREIQDEAEEVLKVLDDEPETAAVPGEAPEADEPVDEPELDEPGAEEPEAEKPEDAAAEKPARGAPLAMAGYVDDAEVLDEESSDPEIQLDLARAYISMGDKEAARVILDEVLTHGSDEQKAEAQSMKDQL